jgi:hypothetical protein
MFDVFRRRWFMDGEQFDRLLSWSILGSLYSAQLVMQSQLGRELTEIEMKKCYKDAYAHADLLYGELVATRR